MTKKHFIQLADAIRSKRPIRDESDQGLFYPLQLSAWEGLRDALASFCASQNPRFNRERWIGYINGDNTANGKPLPACVRSMGTLCAYHASKPNGKKGCSAVEVVK